VCVCERERPPQRRRHRGFHRDQGDRRKTHPVCMYVYIYKHVCMYVRIYVYIYMLSTNEDTVSVIEEEDPCRSYEEDSCLLSTYKDTVSVLPFFCLFV
jgi:hypothetical protein